MAGITEMRVLVSLLMTAAAWQCGNTPDFQVELQPTSPLQRRVSERRLSLGYTREQSQFSPLRIHVEYLALGLSAELEKELRETIMPGALAWFSKSLTINSVVEPLKLDITSCFTLPVPLAHRTTGVNADYILYVYGVGVAYPYVARAGACAYEAGTRNYPVAGMLELNTLNYGSGLTLDMRVEVLIHEMTHALGFTPSIWSKFVGENGDPYLSYNITLNRRGADRVLLTFPTVVAKVKEHFGCDTLEGAELEDAGGSGTASSHWEKRIFGNEYMVGAIAAVDFAFSAITLALFDDSGFYKVVYDHATTFSWGRNQGCNFHTTACLINGVTQFSEFCNVQQEGCEANNLNVGICTISSSLTLPVYNQYFSNPSQGGPDSLGDYCPIYIAYSNTKCKISSVTRSYRTQKSTSKSRCLQGTWGRSKATTYSVASCHEIDCVEGRATVHLDATYSVTCPVEGGDVPLTEPYVGMLPCPPYSTLCVNVPCMAGCLGRGICGAGICNCDPGYSGQRCEYSCNSHCLTCAADNPALCLSCTDHAQLSGTDCACDTGYQWALSGICVSTACSTRCQTCDENGCLSCWANASSNLSSCDCNDGFFPNADGSLCIECGATCRKCSGAKPSQCTACYLGASLYTTGECVCSTGFYLASDATKCAACDSSCRTCSGAGPQSCASCVSPAFLSGTRACICPLGYYASGNGECSKCDSKCWACKDASTCSACATGAVLSGTTCSCSSGAAPSPYCASSCDITCKTCLSASASQCQSCYSEAQSASSFPSACVCQSGYAPSPSANYCRACTYPCATCSSTSSFECLSCVGALYLLDIGLICVSRCPYGYDNSLKTCVARPGKVFDLSFTGYTNNPIDSVSGRVAYSGTSVYFYPTPDNGDPLPAPNAGWVFDGIFDYVVLPPNSNDTTVMSLAPTHYIEIWAKPTNSTGTRQCLLTKRYTNNYYSLCYSAAGSLTLEMQFSNFADPLSTAMQVFDAGTANFDSTWQLVSYQLSYVNKASTITFYLNAKQIAAFPINNGIFLDYSLGGSFLLGAYDASYTKIHSFTGNIAQVVIYQGTQVTPVLKSGCGCETCSSAGNCLSKCTLQQAEVQGVCQACLTACTQGCYRPSDCSLNQDPLCASYTNSTSCTACVPYAASVSGVCACVTHASPSASGTACACNAPYQGNFGINCVACKKYFTASQVSAAYDRSFTKVLVLFSDPVDLAGFQTCASFVTQQSLLKLGTNPSCSWSADSKQMTISLGQSASLVQEPLALQANYIFTPVDSLTCGYLPVDLAPVVSYPGTPPAPVALITAPRTFGLTCGADLVVSGEMSSGSYSRTLTFLWTLSSDIGNTALPSTDSLANLKTFSIPSSSLVASTLSVFLNVQNGFGLNATDFFQIKISSDFLGVQVIGGNNQTFVLSRNLYSLGADFDSRCGFQGTPSFKWTFVSSSAQSSTGQSALTPSGRFCSLDTSQFAPDSYYLFNVSVSLGSASGFALLNVTIAKPVLLTKVLPSSGGYPVTQDLVLSASQSSDPGQLPGTLTYSWACTEGVAECKAADGSPLLTSYVNADSTISASRLRLGATYVFTVTVSKDTRSANETRRISIVAGNGCSVLLTVAFERISEGQSLTVLPSVSAVPAASFLWTQLSGPLISLGNTAATYLVLDTLQAGATYAFQLNVINNVAISAYFNVSGNLPPIHGSLAISPSTGIAVTTYFRLSAAGWEDPEGLDYPLSYQFFSFVTSPLAISSQSLSNTLTTKLGFGSTRVLVVVCDSLKGCGQIYMPVSLSVPSRRLVATAADFQADIVNTALIPSMIVAYSTSLQLELNSVQTMQVALDAYTSSPSAVDSTGLDTALSCLEAMATQTNLVGNMTTIWANYLVSLMQRAVPASPSQIARALTLLGTVNRLSTSLGPIKWLITSAFNSYEANKVPGSPSLTYISSVYSMYSARLLAGAVNGLKLNLGPASVSFPLNFTLDAGLADSQVVDVLFARCNQTDAVADVAWVQVRTAGAYSQGNLALAAPANFSVSNLPQPLNFSIPAVLNPNLTYECLWQTAAGDWRNSCTVLNVTSGSVQLSVPYLAQVTLRLRIEDPDITPTPTPEPEDSSLCEEVRGR